MTGGTPVIYSAEEAIKAGQSAILVNKKIKAAQTANRWGYGDKCIQEIWECTTPEAVESCLELGNKRKEAAQTAHDLCYGEKVVERIWNANSVAKITNILIDARKGVA